ncbi:CBM35 domain-containing protein [Actinophytocola sp.]|uniref:CBM35 domain-containing protein n=1 Tax=Actinophytocola sp. TaxID=1872138 RepID=UPI002D80841C|nr:CBM35 domain-containing protein [Actinophytocola sp.]HET9140833.1 CBM35 domain-containing protein [Actinophytocola sp.]
MSGRTARAALAATLLTAVTLAGPPAAQAAGSTLTVNVAAPVRPVTHAAAGGLYALAENDRPADATLYPLHLRNVVQPAPGAQQRPNGQPPGGDALRVAQQATRVGAGMVIRMPDIYPDFPYRWVSWADWLSKVDAQVTARLAATTVTNVEAWELWNEPDLTWDTAAAGDFNAGWVRTFQRVRSRDTVTPILGPSITGWRADWMRSFLTNARNTGTLPDVVCWHELNHTAPRLAADIAAYRALERELGISPRPISINEYAWTDEVYVPGIEVSYIAKLERAGVEMANRAFWNEYGTVNGLVLNNNQPTAHWWLYRWYGDMAGSMVASTAPTQTGLDGLAAYDPTRRIVNVVLGNESGTNFVRLTGLGALGGTVRVRLESTPDTDRFTAVGAPAVLSDTVQTVSGGALTVTVPNMNARFGYHLVVQPAGGVPAFQQRYEAENASVFRAQRRTAGGASNGGYVGGINNSGDFRTDSYVDFVVTVPTARTYTMAVRYANGTGATATQGLAFNGGGWSTLSYPPTAGWAQFGTVTTTLNLRAGPNTIRLAKGSPFFAGGTGFAELDYLELT